MTYVIIGVHGLANKPPGEIQEKGWQDALCEGLRRNCGVNVDRLALNAIYWASDMYPKPLTKDKEPYTPAEGDGPLKTYRDGWWTELGASVLGAGGKMLDGAKRWLGIDELAEAVLKKKLRDLHRYYTDKDIREKLRGRIGKALEEAEGQRIMVIAHSMGSIIAYDVLRLLGRDNPRFVLDHFITIGSPLGLPHVKQQIYKESNLVRTPSIVKQWTNFADRRDPVAVDVHLADDYQPNDAGVRVRDDLVINGYKNPDGKPNYHKLYGYLRAPELSEVVGRFI